MWAFKIFLHFIIIHEREKETANSDVVQEDDKILVDVIESSTVQWNTLKDYVWIKKKFHSAFYILHKFGWIKNFRHFSFLFIFRLFLFELLLNLTLCKKGRNWVSGKKWENLLKGYLLGVEIFLKKIKIKFKGL